MLKIFGDIYLITIYLLPTEINSTFSVSGYRQMFCKRKLHNDLEKYIAQRR